MALAPVLGRLQRESRVRLENYAYLQAIEVLRAHGLEPQRVPEDARQAWADAEVRQRQPALLLVATSCNGLDHERRFIAAARRRGVRSLALLDFWSNYGARFSDASGQLAYLPDRIAVMDEAARAGLVAEGIPPELISVTGQPAFDALAQARAAFGPPERDALRAAYGTARHDLQVLFASQPLGCEHAVLHDVVDALEEIGAHDGNRFTLVIRPHPRENSHPYEAYSSNAMRIIVSREGDARSAAMASDLVLGMTSVLLVEAWYLRCRVASLQTALRDANPLPPAIAVARSRDDIVPLLRRVMHRPVADAAAPAPTAIARVVECVYSAIPRPEGATSWA